MTGGLATGIDINATVPAQTVGADGLGSQMHGWLLETVVICRGGS